MSGIGEDAGDAAGPGNPPFLIRPGEAGGILDPEPSLPDARRLRSGEMTSRPTLPGTESFPRMQGFPF